jgi:hypothetical protein
LRVWRVGQRPGTIFQERPMMSTFSHLNISFTVLGLESTDTTYLTVAGIEAWWDLNLAGLDEPGYFAVSWCNFALCAEQAIVLDANWDSVAQQNRSSLISCNFISNEVGSGGLLRAEEQGTRIVGCVLSGGLGYSPLICTLGSPAITHNRGKFVFESCVFPASTPAAAFVDISTNSEQCNDLTFLPLTFFGTAYC